MPTLLHGTPQLAAAFLGSAVEAVEAATIVLAVGVVRGWRSALVGTAAALATLAIVAVVFGPAIAAVPIDLLRTVVGVLLLLFGIRWMRKAILRSAGIVPFHDEDAIYAREAASLGAAGDDSGHLDTIALLTAYKAVVLEGIEVVVIVVGIGAAGDTLWPVAASALAACALVALAAALLHRPLARVPENLLKHAVGVMTSAFGLFWFGEGIGIDWPHADAAIVALMSVMAATAAAAVLAARASRRSAGAAR